VSALGSSTFCKPWAANAPSAIQKKPLKALKAKNLFFIKFSLSFVKQTDARIIKRFFFANLPFAKNFSKSIACWLLRYFSTPLKYSQFLLLYFL